MSSRASFLPPIPMPTHHLHKLPAHILLPLVLGGTFSLILAVLVLAAFFHLLTRRRTEPAINDQKPPYRFSYAVLRRATASFSPALRLGHGGFGSVYKASLPSGQIAAVKAMDPSSLQGEHEFLNELSVAANLHSPHIVSLIGFCRQRRRRRMLLVYELMPNRSLQDALLDRKCAELMDWSKRLSIAIDVAKGLEYLHHSCEYPVIHGDIKPSNVLLDYNFVAKIGDFGLARLKTENHVEIPETKAKEGLEGDDNGSIIEEAESVITGFEERVVSVNVDQLMDAEMSPETVAVESPSDGPDKVSLSEGCSEKFSVDSGRDLGGETQKVSAKKGGSGRDWWWRQESGGGVEFGGEKDYVMEWIGNEIKKERPKREWIASPSSAENGGTSTKPEQKQRRRLEWWSSLDEEMAKKEKNRKPREWWKDEFCEELTRKTKKKRGLKSSGSANGGELWWQRDVDAGSVERKKWKSRSRGSIDWWLDGLSGELWSGRRNSQDLASGDMPKSGGVSSTPSMRGTVCYIAPEYGCGRQLSEKCDVYSFGVLLLVLVSGRRPLQVMASPMSEFERGNLISWTRQLAHSGRLLDLVDASIQSLDQEQALLCITVALLCLQRWPGKRPSMKEVVRMLTRETELPHLPFEVSPSPPSKFPS